MKYSILVGLLSTVKLGLCVSPDGVPSGVTFNVQFSTITNDLYYLFYNPRNRYFSVTDNLASAVRVTLDSVTNYLYAPVSSPVSTSGFVDAGVSYDSGDIISLIYATTSDSPEGQGQNPSQLRLTCTLGQISADVDGNKAALLSCSIPGTPLDQFAICKIGNDIFAYGSTLTSPTFFCPDFDGTGQITTFTAISIVDPSLPSSRSTTDISSPTSSGSSSTTDAPALTSPASSPYTLPASTVQGSCSVTFELDLVTKTVLLPQGASIPASSTDTALASTLTSLRERYGCVQLHTMGI